MMMYCLRERKKQMAGKSWRMNFGGFCVFEQSEDVVGEVSTTVSTLPSTQFD